METPAKKFTDWIKEKQYLYLGCKEELLKKCNELIEDEHQLMKDAYRAGEANGAQPVQLSLKF